MNGIVRVGIDLCSSIVCNKSEIIGNCIVLIVIINQREYSTSAVQLVESIRFISENDAIMHISCRYLDLLRIVITVSQFYCFNFFKLPFYLNNC